MSRILQVLAQDSKKGLGGEIAMRGDADNNINNNKFLQAAEYLGLRAEIIEWQSRRINMLVMNLSLFGIVLGVLSGKTPSSGEAGNTDSILPRTNDLFCIFVIFETILVWIAHYMLHANAKLSAYLRVYHENDVSHGQFPAYEKRLKDLNAKQEFGIVSNINDMIFTVFIFLPFALIGVIAYRGGLSMNWMKEPFYLPGSSMAVLIVSCLYCWHKGNHARIYWEEKWNSTRRPPDSTRRPPDTTT
jgi:hypothetical protein